MNKKHDISLEEFKFLYANKGMIYQELANYFNCSLATIRRFAKRHKVTPIRGKSKHRKIIVQKSNIKTNLNDTELFDLYKKSLNSKQLEIILGSLLGDSYCKTRKNKNGETINIHFGHSEKQIGYLNFTHKELENVANDISLERKEGYFKIKDKGEYKNKNFYSFSTKPLNPFLKKIIFKNNKKTVNMEWLNLLTPRSLAFWYMDDGNLNLNNRVSRFATMGFSKEENNIIKKYFYDSLKMPCFVAKTKEGYEVVLTQNSTKKFLKLISPYLSEDMEYKSSFNNDPVETLKADDKSVSKEEDENLLNIAEHPINRMVV